MTIVVLSDVLTFQKPDFADNITFQKVTLHLLTGTYQNLAAFKPVHSVVICPKHRKAMEPDTPKMVWVQNADKAMVVYWQYFMTNARKAPEEIFQFLSDIKQCFNEFECSGPLTESFFYIGLVLDCRFPFVILGFSTTTNHFTFV